MRQRKGEEKKGEAEKGGEVECLFAVGDKVRMVEEDDKEKRFLGEVATVEKVCSSGQVFLKFDKGFELGAFAGRDMSTKLLELAGDCKAALG